MPAENTSSGDDVTPKLESSLTAPPICPCPEARSIPHSLISEALQGGGKTFLKMEGFGVKLLKGNIVVKYGPTRIIRRDEGLAMELAREHGIVEAPEGDTAYLFMSFIDGSVFDMRTYISLTRPQKGALKSSLQRIISTLRSIPTPKSARIGGLTGEAAPLVWICYPDEHKAIPSFANESEMNNWLADLLSDHPICSWMTPRFRSAPTSNELVFTHGDLAGRNILFKDGKLVGLIDWELSGWYPRYFEPVRAADEARKGTLVEDIIMGLVPTYPEEETRLYSHFVQNSYWWGWASK